MYRNQEIPRRPSSTNAKQSRIASSNITQTFLLNSPKQTYSKFAKQSSYSNLCPTHGQMHNNTHGDFQGAYGLRSMYTKPQ